MLRDLIEKRDAHARTAKNILDAAEGEKRALTAAEQKDLDSLYAKLEGLNATIRSHDQLNVLRQEMEKPLNSAAPLTAGGMVYRGAVREGEVRAYSPKEAIAAAPYSGPGLGAFVRGIVTGNWRGAEDLRSDMGEGTGALGGFLVPAPLSNQVIDKMRAQNRVIQAGALSVPMTSSSLTLARLSGDPSASWKAENASLSFSDCEFEAVVLRAKTLIAAVKCSVELIEDAPNIDQVVNNALSAALAGELDRVALYGIGADSEPRGIKNQTGVTVHQLAANGDTLDDYSPLSTGISTLMGLNYPGPFSAIYSARTAGDLDNLQDTLHQPLQQPALVAAMQKLVSNQVSNTLPTGGLSDPETATDVFIGQFSEALIGMRTDLKIEASRVAADSSGSAFSNLQVFIRAYLRADITLAHPAFYVLTNVLPAD